jgi:hypothetical protein
LMAHWENIPNLWGQQSLPMEK